MEEHAVVNGESDCLSLNCKRLNKTCKSRKMLQLVNKLYYRKRKREENENVIGQGLHSVKL